jgi:hypothetical protein
VRQRFREHQRESNDVAHFQPELSRVDRHRPTEIVFSLMKDEHLRCNFVLYIEFARTTSSALMKLPPVKFTIRLTICAAALLLSTRYGLAQSPTPCPDNGSVTINTAVEETLLSSINPIRTPLHPS